MLVAGEEDLPKGPTKKNWALGVGRRRGSPVAGGASDAASGSVCLRPAETSPLLVLVCAGCSCLSVPPLTRAYFVVVIITSRPAGRPCAHHNFCSGLSFDYHHEAAAA